MLRSLIQKITGSNPQHDAYLVAVNNAGFPPDVAAALTRPLDDSEKAAIARVEQMRKRVNADTRTVEFVDFGAGKPNSGRSKEEMAAGVTGSKVIGDICRTASKGPIWAEALFRLVRYGKPNRCIELGTCLGVSAAYIAAALDLNSNKGTLITLEGAPALAREAQANVDSVGLNNTKVIAGRFADTFLPALQEMKPVDFLFVDGHHDRDATMDYFLTARPYLDAKNIIVFDDITWSAGMREVWADIKAQTKGYTLDALGVSLNVTPDRKPT